MVVKSTVPVGFTRGRVATRLGARLVVFSPEFLREGRALWDNLHPSRIVVGERGEPGPGVRRPAQRGGPEPTTSPCCSPTAPRPRRSSCSPTPTSRCGWPTSTSWTPSPPPTASTAAQIIDGVGLDPRIGSHYNNPSFGYGGYCLPKDTKQLLANYQNVPQNLIEAIVDANATRKDFVAAGHPVDGSPQVVGIHRLIMKAESDNFRCQQRPGDHEADQGQGRRGRRLRAGAADDTSSVRGSSATSTEFKAAADVIVANRLVAELADVADKVYTRDLFGGDQ